MRTEVMAHRGQDLDAEAPRPLASSVRAYTESISAGFGTECDVRMTKDGQLVVFSGTNLAGVSGGFDKRFLHELTAHELTSLHFGADRFMEFGHWLDFVERQNPKKYHAIHVKADMQDDAALVKIVNMIELRDLSRFIIFDLTLVSAVKIYGSIPNVQLGASVADPFDIARYGKATGSTLMDLKTAIENNRVYTWVVLDEWDIRGPNGGIKRLVTQNTMKFCRDRGMKTMVISPELHATWSGMIDGVVVPNTGPHEDGQPGRRQLRVLEIINLRPDVICTNYPRQAQVAVDVMK